MEQDATGWSTEETVSMIQEQDATDMDGDWGEYEGLHSAVRKLVAARCAKDVLAALPQEKLGAVREATRNLELLEPIVRSHNRRALPDRDTE